MTLQLEEVSWGECANFEISPRLVVSHVPHIPTGKIYVPEMRHEDARRGSGEGGMALKSRERDGKRRRETEGGRGEGKSGFSCCNTTFLGLARLSKREGCAARAGWERMRLLPRPTPAAAHTFLPFIARCAPDFPSVCPPSVRLARHPLRTISPARVIVFSAIMERRVRILGGIVKSFLT